MHFIALFKIQKGSLDVKDSKRFSVPLPSLAKGKPDAEATTSPNSAFTQRTLRVLGLRQPIARSLRLLKNRSASVVPSLWVRKRAGR